MEIDELITNYPRLFHMAEKGSWPSIRQHGLLSTRDLLDLFEVKGALRTQLLTQRRPASVPIAHAKYGTATVRDQIPLIESKLRSSLTGGMTPTEWYQLLNERIFFWVTEERLQTLLNAKSYRTGEHDVLTLDTAAIVEDYSASIHLAHMNTGNTQPIAHPRGPDTFKAIAAYPYSERKKKRLEPFAEFTVLGGVRNIERYALKAERWVKGKLVETIYTKVSDQ